MQALSSLMLISHRDRERDHNLRALYQHPARVSYPAKCVLCFSQECWEPHANSRRTLKNSQSFPKGREWIFVSFVPSTIPEGQSTHFAYYIRTRTGCLHSLPGRESGLWMWIEVGWFLTVFWTCLNCCGFYSPFANCASCFIACPQAFCRACSDGEVHAAGGGLRNTFIDQNGGNTYCVERADALGFGHQIKFVVDVLQPDTSTCRLCKKHQKAATWMAHGEISFAVATLHTAQVDDDDSDEVSLSPWVSLQRLQRQHV